MKSADKNGFENKTNRHNTIAWIGLDANVQTHYRKDRLIENNSSERKDVFRNFPEFLEINETTEDTENIIEIKRGHYSAIQNAYLLPLQLQKDMGREIYGKRTLGKDQKRRQRWFCLFGSSYSEK